MVIFVYESLLLSSGICGCNHMRVYENSIKLLNTKSKMSRLRGNLIKRILWRLQYKKVAFTPEQRAIGGGRCVKCDAGPQLNKKSCSDYGCTCTMEQQYKRK